MATVKGKKITITPPPPGVVERDVEIIEVPVENELEERFYAKYISVDKTQYRFRTHGEDGKPFPYREQMALFLCMAEIAKGGNPASVLSAFKVELIDSNKRKAYSWK
jgi:hypothetical protein